MFPFSSVTKLKSSVKSALLLKTTLQIRRRLSVGYLAHLEHMFRLLMTCRWAMYGWAIIKQMPLVHIRFIRGPGWTWKKSKLYSSHYIKKKIWHWKIETKLELSCSLRLITPTHEWDPVLEFFFLFRTYVLFLCGVQLQINLLPAQVKMSRHCWLNN